MEQSHLLRRPSFFCRKNGNRWQRSSVEPHPPHRSLHHSKRCTTVKIIRYYPRAFSGDGGMTNAVRHWSEGFVRAGAEVVIAYEDGQVPDSWASNKVDCRRLR